MTKNADNQAVLSFRRNLKAIHELLRFDDLLLEIILAPLKRTHERQLDHRLGPRLRNDAVITVLENIRQHESLRAHYEAMYNQSLVLLVSYFGSAIKQLFIDSTAEAINAGTVPAVLDAQLRISPREVRERGPDMTRVFAESIADAKDISFQDMQSIGRAFEKYFGSAPPQDQHVNNIIAGQACRHAIVHNGAVIDRKLVGQLRAAEPRMIVKHPLEGEGLRFRRDEVQLVAKDMLRYLRDLLVIVESTGTQTSNNPTANQ